MPYLIAAVVGALLIGVALWTGLWWAAPIILIALIIYAIRERGSMATVTTSGGPEPTGMPRARTSSAETANERVGQS